MSEELQTIAKIRWTDPVSGEANEYVLAEGATASIGRSSGNDIIIVDRHVSRQHAVITYRDGVFLINDLGSVNGTFVNDERLTQPFPLCAGDKIRLYVPELSFSAADDADVSRAVKSGHFITTASRTGAGRLTITTGAQEGLMIPLIKAEMTVGRATERAAWDICIQDPSVSRPHAKITCVDQDWFIEDMDSSNGTKINDVPVLAGVRHALNDGDTLALGRTIILFRGG